MVDWLGDYSPLSTPKSAISGQTLGWRFSSATLRMAHDTVISQPCCRFVQWLKIGQHREGSVITLVPTVGWKLTNHHKTYLSAQCDIVCNCCSSVPITYEHLMTLAVYYHFCAGLDLECSFSVKSKRSIRGISHPWYQIFPLRPKPDVRTNNNWLVHNTIPPANQPAKHFSGLVVLAKQLFWTVLKPHLWSYCCICSIYHYCRYKV